MFNRCNIVVVACDEIETWYSIEKEIYKRTDKEVRVICRGNKFDILEEVKQTLPYVVIIDIRLRDMLAFEIAEAIRNIGKGIRILFLVSEISLEIKILTKGFADKLVMFNDIDHLVRLIKSYIAECKRDANTERGKIMGEMNLKDYLRKDVHQKEHENINKSIKVLFDKNENAVTKEICRLKTTKFKEEVIGVKRALFWVIGLIFVNILIVIGVGLILNSTNVVDYNSIKEIIENKVYEVVKAKMLITGEEYAVKR